MTLVSEKKQNIKVFLVHSVQSCVRFGGIDPLFLNLCIEWRRVVILNLNRFTPGKNPGTH
jgi:hypothetical protein